MMDSSPQLDLFAARLPHRPYCTDDLAAGVRVRPRERAARARYIQPNPPASVGYLVFDVDREGAAVDWEFRGLPCPSIVATNPANGHAHLFYAVESPVIKTNAARMQPMRFMAAVQGAMTVQLDADPCYSMFIAKNPLNPAWRTLSYSNAVYGLPDLAEYVDLTRVPQKRARAEISGLGRNCDLFDTLRRKAYRNVATFRAGGDAEAWHRFILDAARKLNVYLPALPDSEVRAVARSVAKWTWRNFGGGAAHDRFIERQRARARLAARVKRGKASERVLRAVEALQQTGKRVTVSAVARLVGMDRRTVQRFYRPLLNTIPMLGGGGVRR